MNHLAHFYLARERSEWLVGALLGDYVKGCLSNYDCDEETRRGIALHRSIDSFVDRQPEIKIIRQSMPSELRRFAGPISDVVFDHILASEWTRYGAGRLERFSQKVYATLKRHKNRLPVEAQTRARRFAEHDVLSNFKHWQTIWAVLQHIGWRLSRANPLREEKTQELIYTQLPHIKIRFSSLFPKLVIHCKQQTANRIDTRDEQFKKHAVPLQLS